MAGFVLALLKIYYWLVIIRVLLSWIPLPESQAFQTIYKYIYDVTEPYLSLFRRVMPRIGSGGMNVDLSPILAILVLIVLESFVTRVLSGRSGRSGNEVDTCGHSSH